MENTIMAISIDPRTSHAPQVQTILTKFGFIIKTRLGLHEISEGSSKEHGLILLHINSDSKEVKQLEQELNTVEGVKVKSMVL